MQAADRQPKAEGRSFIGQTSVKLGQMAGCVAIAGVMTGSSLSVTVRKNAETRDQVSAVVDFSTSNT
jgi:hypothetical protein